MRQMILLLFAGLCLLPTLQSFAAPPSPEMELQIQQGLLEEPYEYTRQTDLGPPSQYVTEMVRGHLRTEFKILVIPFQYADYPAVSDATYLDSLFFGDYFGTVRDYYREITVGNFTLTTLHLPSEIGWLTVSGTLEDYHTRPPTTELLQLADPYVDYSDYDNDGDGTVNSILLLHAGRGRESGGGSHAIWSHCGSFNRDLVIDGVHFWRYSAVPEYSHTPHDEVIGVICHELGHQIMRWWDLYGNPKPYGPSTWCLMTNGSWNGSPSGTLPAHPNLYCKLFAGLLELETVTQDITAVQFPDVHTGPTIPRLWMNGERFCEYFLIENRQRTGYDADVPSDGLLVYHINIGNVGHGSDRRNIEIVPAGNSTLGSRYPYPGYGYDNRTLDSTSTPNSRDYNGNNSFVAIRNISNSGPVMTADIFVENPNPPSVEIAVPTLGDNWFTGDTNRILWNSSGVFNDQKVEVRREGGAWEVVTDSVENAGYFDWVTDYPLADPANIRISDVYVPSTQDVSDDFAIIPPTLSITYPNPGITWKVGDLVTILWETTGMDVWETVRIEIQRDGGHWDLIVDDCANTGSYAWEVTTPITDLGANLRITSLDDPSVTDSVAMLHIVRRTLNLTSPNAFDYYALGDDLPITWELNGFTDLYVDIALTRNYGQFPTHWETIESRVRASSLHYTWRAEGALSTHARIRISGHTQTTIADTSYENFTICNEHGLAVLAPTGEIPWCYPDTMDITWSSENFLPSEPLKIELSRSYDPHGCEWELLTANTPNNGSWSWAVSPPESHRARIRISSVNHPEVRAVSQNDFIVGVKSITVRYPNGGEHWMPGDTVAISWDFEYLDPRSQVLIDIHRTDPESPGHEWLSVFKEARMDQPYTWIVDSITATDALISVRSNSYPMISDTSDDYFCVGDFSMEVTSPNGHEIWVIGQQKEITWTTDIQDESVRIEIDRRYPSGHWELITSNAHNNGSYSWSVNGPISQRARVRISSVYDPAISDTSDGPFSINSHGIEVVTPEGGELWWLGETYDIEWNSWNFTSEDSLIVDIYRGRGRLMWEEVARVPILDGVYSWQATGWYSSVVKVRLTSIRAPEVSDTSADFTTNLPVLTITSPNGWETLTIGDVHRIEWTMNYELEDTISLAMSRNHPYGGWETIVDSIPNIGYYDWTVTGPPADSARIEIFSTIMYWPKDISDTIFTIESTYPIYEPRENTMWRVGETVDIVWGGDVSSSHSHIRPEPMVIELCRDFTTEQRPRWELIGDRVPNIGRYSWTVTRPASRRAKLRIAEAGDRDNYSYSDGTFRILDLFSIFRTDGPQESDPNAAILQCNSLNSPLILESLTLKTQNVLPSKTRITLATHLYDDGTIDCVYDNILQPESRAADIYTLRFNKNGVASVGINSPTLYVFVSNPSTADKRQNETLDNLNRVINPDDVSILAVFAGNPELTLRIDDSDIVLSWDSNNSPAFNIYRSDSPDEQGELIATANESEYIDHDILKAGSQKGFYHVVPQSQTIVPSTQLSPNLDNRAHR